MITDARSLFLAVVWLLMPFVAAPQAAGPHGAVTTISASGPARDVPYERTYVLIPGGDESRLLDLWHALDEAGARKIHVFLPDMIVCSMPSDTDARSVAFGADVIVRAGEELTPRDAAGLRVSPIDIHRRYERKIAYPHDGGPAGIATQTPPAADGVPNEPDVRVIPEDVMYRTARAASRTTAARAIHQHSELLSGSILVQLVMPESQSTWRNWDDDGITAVVLAMHYTMDDYMDEFENADIDVLYRVFERAETAYEPIWYPPDNDAGWISDTLNRLEVPGSPAAYLEQIHAFNTEGRLQYRTDWVFSAFIASADRDADGMFANARNVSWSYMGGPYFASSYPCAWRTEPEYLRSIYKHEIGHIFWGLEEDLGTAASCEDYSGYLNVPNYNKVTQLDPIAGLRRGCGQDQHPIPCYMNQTDALYGYFSDGCEYTQQMFGISDLNENLVPDAFDIPPVVVFDVADVETVTTPVAQTGVTVVARAIANANPMQPDGLRQSYAAELKDISVSIDRAESYTLRPDDVGSDGWTADFTVLLPPMIPGWMHVDVSARNAFNAECETRTKSFLYVHIHYTDFEITYPNAGTKVSFKTIGRTFDAHFQLHRVNRATGEHVVVADGLEPLGPPAHGRTTFEFLDTAVKPGEPQSYYVTAEINLPYRDGVLHKEVESAHVSTVAAVPRPASVSRLAPNPFTERTWLSINVPVSDDVTTGSGAVGATDTAPVSVAVSVYDIRGRLVKEVFERDLIQRVLTLSWDGTDANGRDVPMGIYFIRVQVAQKVDVRKVLLMR